MTIVSGTTQSHNRSRKTHRKTIRILKCHIVGIIKKSKTGTSLCNLLMEVPAIHDIISRLDSGDKYANAASIFAQSASCMQEVENAFKDSLSRQSYAASRTAMATQCGRWLRKYAQPLNHQYFDPTLPIPASAYRCFVDCGAYSGDTISALCGHIGVESIEALYAFEPDSVSRAQLSTLCESKGIRNYSLFPIAVWNQPEELKFLESGTTASHIAQEGTKNIQANTLDHVLSSQKVTFLKMDIEGAELRALQGASNLIQSQRPVLAVCLYHTPEDLFLIPRYIRTLVSDYQLFVRIYSKSLFGEVVCYAIPPEYIKSK